MPAAVDILGVLPFVASEAAYVGLLSVDGDLVVRTYDAEGVALEDVAGPFTDNRDGQQFSFIRGATENSVEGCAIAYMGGDGDSGTATGEDDLYVIDIPGDAQVAVATTHRPALGGGDCLLASVRAGADGFWYECGTRGQIGDDQGYLRKIHRDGVTSIAAVVADIPTLDEPSGPRRPYPINATAWTVDESDAGDSQTVTEAGSVATVPGVTGFGGDNSKRITAGVVLGSTAGTSLNRVALDAGVYDVEDLFAIPSFTVSAAGTRRTSGELVALVNEGSTETHQASRLCTYSGSHPITTSTAGPAFERDDNTETLLAVWGL